MRILVDTNVILDILLNRNDFVETSREALEKAISNGDRLYFSSSSVTDVYYLIRKSINRNIALKAIMQMSEIFIFATVDSDCILTATLSKIGDYEDALVDTVASSIDADYIMTRNILDFKNARNKIISPSGFLDN